MRPSLRFLLVAVMGWAGIRAAALGVIPGAEMFSIQKSEAKPPPVLATEFPPIEPPEPIKAIPAQAPYLMPFQQMPVAIRPVTIPVYYAAASVPAPRPQAPILPEPPPRFYAPIPALDEWPLSRIASASVSARRSSVVAPAQSMPVAPRPALDRIQLTSWALLRGRQGQLLGTPSLAAGGTLGGSQAGGRLTYNFTRQIAATLRTTSEVGRRGSEVAAGVRVQPLASIPLWLTAERRQRLGRDGSGRNAFALFAESGVYQRPMPWQFQLDAYLQGGIVGLRTRDYFVDGGLSFTRPVYRQFSAGLGMWGAAQQGLYRVDAGPRVSMQVRKGVKIHFDWRQKVAGNAQPGSGPAVTLAGDF